MTTVDGIEFKCTGCGACCRWEGKVYLTPEDIERLSARFGDPVTVFMERCTEVDRGVPVLRNKPDSSDCIFMDGDKCSVWGDHPEQCREWPKRYDSRCPGFINGEVRMDFKEAVEHVNRKFSAMREWDQTVSDQFYCGLMGGSEAKVASKAMEGGANLSAKAESVRLASMDDLFSFHRASDNHLIHKATRDLWAIESDADGGISITRLFDNDGEPIKG